MAIYDCFPFFYELELLDLRLILLNNKVDYFVIVEMNRTQRGEKKEYIFEENKHKYKRYLNKIIHIKVDADLLIDIENNIKDGSKNWILENYQRNCIMSGLKNCNLEDIVMISDIDEIPNLPNTLNDILNQNVYIKNFWRAKIGLINKILKINPLYLFKTLKVKNIIDLMPISLEQNMYYYYLNGMVSTKWYGTVICKYKNIETPQNVRNDRNRLFTIKNGGWHFSHLGGIEKIQKNIINYRRKSR